MWIELPEKPARVFATGDVRRPALLVAGDGGVRLFQAATGAFEPVDLPVLARDVTSALVSGGRLYVGTSGYGVLMRDLEEPAPAPQTVAGGAN
jgi:hypothetical protein